MNLTLSARRTYYEDGGVQQRLGEFFGGTLPDKTTAVFLAAGSEAASNHRERLPLEELPGWLQQGAELNRSLWDRQSLLAHLDIEYVNFDFPARAYLHPERTFRLQEPVVEVVKQVLGSFGIHPLHLLTGRGHHFVWRVKQTSKAFAQLAALGHVADSLQRLYATERAPTDDSVSPVLGAAFAGLGLVVEFLAHRIKAQAAARCEIPVELAAIETGGGGEGREMIALDITEYSDPLCSRVVRVPFSVYLKPSQQQAALGEETFQQLPPMFVVPVADMTLPEALRTRLEMEAVMRLAQTASAKIPDTSRPMEDLIAAYQSSPLARFHEEYYSQEHDDPSRWPETYDRTALDSLPACARHMIEHPNDLLLRPGCVQRVVRVLLALGWHPRHVAGLIRSKYERDYGWGDQWQGCDPATRADFYARVFSGAFITGVDDLVDFNCQSAREENLCFMESCNENLLRFRDSLLDRRQHERLARRPFHRLFLPKEHL